MKRHSIALIRLCLILVLLSLASCNSPASLGQEEEQEIGSTNTPDRMESQEVEAPVIDGVVNEQEWQPAKVQHFYDGSEIYLMISGDHLYLAVRAVGGGMIAGNVFLWQENGVAVMHTSAALGTALYQRDEERYQKIKDFDWCCRSKIDDALSQSAREVFFGEEGWLGVNSFLGNANELEYKISLRDMPHKLAVNFIQADGGGEKQVWPVGLEDGVALPSSGGFPDLIIFDVGKWFALEEMQ